MSVLSREHLTLEVEMRDVATLMELMTKTISSARWSIRHTVTSENNADISMYPTPTKALNDDVSHDF